jgi:hypothetical protein
MLRVLNTKQALERMRKLLRTLMLAIPFLFLVGREIEHGPEAAS